MKRAFMRLDLQSPEAWITAGLFAAGLALIACMVWLERRPRTKLDPLLLPTTPFMFAGGLVALLALVHLLNLAGIHTGR
jgi:ABC-type Mn2+/Zn2+ transport system permease subunit